MKQQFVTFLSPGTFLHEDTTKPIESWDIEKAKEMARDIKERHGATPFAFYFTTRARADDELDSKQVEKSCTYYLGGKIETLADVEARNDPKEDIKEAERPRLDCGEPHPSHLTTNADLPLTWEQWYKLLWEWKIALLKKNDGRISFPISKDDPLSLLQK